MGSISYNQFKRVIPVGQTFFYDKLKKLVNIDKMYNLFKTDKLTTKEKRTILYNSKKLDRDTKNLLWDAYINQGIIDYSEVPDFDYEED